MNKTLRFHLFLWIGGLFLVFIYLFLVNFSWTRMAVYDRPCMRFFPISISNAQLIAPDSGCFCKDGIRRCYGPAVEEHGKIAVAQMPHTGELVREHGAEAVRISALGYDLIADEDYIRRLLRGKYGKVDCILKVEWPNGERIYIEVEIAEADNEREATFDYIPLTISEFASVFDSAPEKDKTTFYNNINDDQTWVRPHLMNHLSE